MMAVFLKHQWYSFWRSRNLGRSLLVQVLMGLLVLYLLGIALFVGFSMKAVITALCPGQDMVKVFSSFLLYYFCMDLLVRYMMQDLPTLSIQPYLIQNIRRRQLIRFLQLRSLAAAPNFFPLLLLLPFSLLTIRSLKGGAVSAAFVATIVFLTLFNNFALLYIKRRTFLNGGWLAGFFLFMAALMGLDYLKVFSLSRVSASLFGQLLVYPLLALLTLLLAVTAYKVNGAYLHAHLYLEELSTSARKRESAEYSWLQRFGITGELLGLDLKLIQRNKKSRKIAWLSLMLLLYGFIFYRQENLDRHMYGMILLGAMVVTGGFISNYGQLAFAWQSSYFDGLMSQNIRIRDYIKAKFFLFTAACTICFVLGSFYAFISPRLLLIQLAACLYNIGVNSVIITYFAALGTKPIDINRSEPFNYQGISAAQWVSTLVVMLAGGILYLPLALLWDPWAGIALVGLAGLVSALLRDWWIDLIARTLVRNKYKMLAGFREK